MTASLAQSAIALLIDLAERGEIDPWDVQVIEVIDRFLSKLQPPPATTHGPAPYEADLSESGQAFLYASMLLLLKADSLARLEQREEEVGEGELLDIDSFVDAPLPLNLERRIRRRAVSPPAQNRRVTLQELIAQLNVMASAMNEHRAKRITPRRPKPQSRSQAIRAIADLAHQENLSEIAIVLEEFLRQHWQAMSQDNAWLDFELLLEMWTTSQDTGLEPSTSSKKAAITAETKSTVHDRVGVFWALLFLSAQSKVELNQEVFYRDLKVRSLTAEDLGTNPPTDQAVLSGAE